MINISKTSKNKNKIIGIYKITNPKGKVYIGQSSNINNRKYFYKYLKCYKQPIIYSSLLKYGWENHQWDIIEECSWEQLNIRERYWQEYYDVIGPNGLNCILTNTDKLPRKLSKSALLNKQETCYKRPIKQYTVYGNFIRDWESVALASRELGISVVAIHNICNLIIKSPKQFIFRYLDSSQEMLENVSYVKYKNRNREIIQYDLEDNFIREWDSITEVKRELNYSFCSINSVCRGKSKTANGFKWKFKK